ncbi:DUF1330 domain-containing protein [Chelatococcus asaccharovorans]|uniref:Uncharacterized protein (DUF1330 family) n=1 Tax=Chelatococcus asaccharovorans TaxID=28210 RepID=A0A2V3TRV1_9HYPH|nr:DUF1330 domain-containing protein [Chelatococcus asaccharovorans]MBS7704876.1 DUF1330 domain-containing protein [Chelatococcus asaccharovorans]PXW51339.1 uncharacterized protein (DUF1330 family) [Chelatococcus asaccharovorans]CAH1650829.1 conserved hypothetical protein [Chelatococcus asaccharovorans]CAH1686708.1 conserved hypothetical protein [Chelatococcus asaccharovorans]
MPKGYMIARVTVTNPEAYAEYVALASEVIRAYGGKLLTRGGRTELLEGEMRPRNVVIEFETYEKAIAYYNSPEYQRAKKARENAGVADMIAVEGV